MDVFGFVTANTLHVTVASAFTAVSYAVNPGLAATFAWLSNLASNYESYCLSALSFVIETQCSTSTAGSIQMAMDYDAADGSPASKQALMSYHNAVRSPAWGDCRFVADKQDLLKFGSQRFIRSTALAANQDVKTYDVGNLWVATSGGAGVLAGELYVEYDVELMTPQTGAAIGGSSKVVSGGSVSKTAIFGTVPVITGSLLSPSTSTDTLTVVNAGHYMLEIEFTGTGIGQNLAVSGTATSVVLSCWNSAVTQANFVISVDTTAANQTCILDASGWTSVTASLTRIIKDASPDFAAI